MRSSTLLLLGAAAGLCLRCSTSPVSGGTTDTGNAKIAAVIHTSSGARAVNATVTVCPAGYHSGGAADSIAKRLQYVTTGSTDDTGYFGIDSIESGEYVIEVNDGISSAVLIPVSVSPSTDSTVVLEDTLAPYAAIEGNVGTIDDTSVTRYLVIYGLERRTPVAPDGACVLSDLPAGTFHCRVIADREEWVPLDFNEVKVDVAATVRIAVPDTHQLVDSTHRAEIVLNTAASGAAVTHDVYGFPVLVRLTGSNFPFGEAEEDGADIRFIKQDGTPIAFTFETWDAVRYTAAIWVRMDTLYGNNATQSFQMLWGNTASVPLHESGTVFDTAAGFYAGYHLCGTLDDVTLHACNGIDSGTTDAVDGIIGRARSFNGKSQFFSIGNLPDRERGTISCWFRPAVTVNAFTPKTMGIWGKRDSDERNYSLSLAGADYFLSYELLVYGKLVAKLENPDAGYYVSSTTGSFEAGQWYFVAWSWGDHYNALYINGELEASIPNSSVLSGSSPETIGRCDYDTKNIGPYGGLRYFFGTLDEFRIDTAKRNAAWIRLCYLNQRIGGTLVTVARRE